MTRPAARVARVLFGLAGVGFLLVAFVRAWNETEGHVLPSFASVSAAGVAIAIGIGAGALGWAALFERADLRYGLVRSFVMSQLGKYIPGTVWQYVGQVSFATSAGAPLARTAVVLPVHIVIQVAAAGTIGALAGALAPSAPMVWRFVPLAGGAAAIFLYRPLLLTATRIVSRFGAVRLTDPDLPTQSAIGRAYFWTIGTLIASGAGFALMLASIDPASPLVAAVAVYSLAWLAGFLAVLVPAGLGVREMVLMALLPASPGAIVAVSICHRILTMAVEGAALFAARTQPR